MKRPTLRGMPNRNTPRRVLPIALLLLSIGCASKGQVKLGVDTLADDNYALLKGKRVGLVVNPASVDGNREPTVLVLQKHANVVALFGPEHGVWGDEYAGKTVADSVDPSTGIRVYSLYGKTKIPSPERLAEMDVVVFDLQDIGSRSYTYINTMKNVLLGCAAADKPLVILDRPNPLGGQRIEGDRVTKGLESGVSSLDVPYVHGMTMGELALWTRDRLAPDFKKLHIVKMKGWTRGMTWADTGLDWIPTSPHVPHVSSVAAYTATGIAGELYQFSNGVGYTQPFEIVGGPGVDGVSLASKLNRVWPDDKGIYFRPVRFKPYYGNLKGQACEGVQVHINPHTAPSLVEINYRVIEAMNAPALFKIANTPAPKKPSSTQTTTTQSTSAPSTTKATTAPADADVSVEVSPLGRRNMFDKVTGSTEAGDLLTNGQSLDAMFAKWRATCEKFRKEREKYLLYR